MKHSALIPCLALAAAVIAAGGDKKKHDQDEDQNTQALQLPPDLPATKSAEADRLVFQLTPLHGSGLLSQQLREALKPLLRKDRPLVKLRAFVAGTGDTRRVQAVVSEMCTEKDVPLPALTSIQVGELPLDGAQIVLESVALEKKPVNPGGIVMVPAESDFENRPLQPVLPHVRRVLDKLRAAMAAAGAGADDVLQVTCYATSLDEVDQFRAAVADAFPKAVPDVVQPLRAALESGATCEAVGRRMAPQGAGTLIFTGAQLAFGTAPGDARLAFERLGKTLAQAGASYGRVVHVTIYSMSRSTSELAERAAREFFDPAKPPALTAVAVEALPSLDASFAVDAVAMLPASK